MTPETQLAQLRARLLPILEAAEKNLRMPTNDKGKKISFDLVNKITPLVEQTPPAGQAKMF